MINRNSEISFLVDTMIVQTVLSNDSGLSKTAQAGGLLGSLITKVKDYVGAHIKPDNKLGSLIDILGPGAITMTLSALGFGWMGWLVGLAMSVFHINISEIMGTVWDKIKSMLGGGKQVSSAQVDSAVSSAFQEHDKPMTQQDAEAAQKELDKQKAWDGDKYSNLREARILRMALVQYRYDQERFISEGGLLDMLMGRKAKTSTLLSTILSWVLKIGLASAGLMVAGDVVNNLLDRPSAFNGGLQHGQETAQVAQQQAAPAMPTTKQTKFKVKSGFVNEQKNNGSDWVENVPNDAGSIENLLIDFAKQVYDGLDGKEAYIRNAPGLQAIKDKIATYNRASEGDNFVFIPKYLTSKKQIVDYFIDDVAETAPDNSQTPQ